MRERYGAIMDRVALTPESRQRILSRALAARRKRRMRLAAVSAAACLALVLALGGLRTPVQPQTQRPNRPVTSAGRPEPTDSREALEALVGFPVQTADHLPFEPLQVRYSAPGAALAQTAYAAGEQTALLRQMPGTEDCSGDFTVYASEVQVSVGGREVRLKGDTEDRLVLAVWTDGGMSFSLRLSAGISAEAWTPVIEGVR